MNEFSNIKFIFIVIIIFYKTILNSSNYYKNNQKNKIINPCNQIIKYAESWITQSGKSIRNKIQNLLMSSKQKQKETQIKKQKSQLFKFITNESKIKISPSNISSNHLVDLANQIENINEDYGRIYLVGRNFKNSPNNLLGHSVIIIACKSENDNFLASNCINLIKRSLKSIQCYTEEIDIRKEHISLLIHTPDYKKKSMNNIEVEEVLALQTNAYQDDEEIFILPIEKI